MKLKVLKRYQNTARNINVYPGDEIEVKDELAQWLQNDAPGCFENPNAPASKEEQQPSDEARKEADALLGSAQKVLSEAQQEAERRRTEVRRDDTQPPFDLPPDGTTVRLDATPPVITGPDSGVEVTHRATEEEQQAVLEEQQALDEEEQPTEEKSIDAPPVDKAIKRAPRHK